MSALEPALSVWFRWIGEAGAALLLLAPLAALGDFCLLRRAGPRARALLWTLVLARACVPPGIGLAAAPVGRLAPLFAASPAAPASSASIALALPARGPTEALTLLGALWLGGLLALGATSARRQAGWMRSARGRGTRPAPRRVLVQARAAARCVGLGTLPEIRLDAGARGPLLVGIRRPVVLLPRALAAHGAEERLFHALCHELAHVRRRDPAAALACHVLHLFLWFHPVAWLARRRLEALRELACDRHVVRALGEREGYRRTLLALARPLAARPTPAGVALRFGGSALLARLAALDQERGAPATVPAAAALVVAQVALALPSAPRPTHEPTVQEAGCLRRRFTVFRALAEAGGWPASELDVPVPKEPR